MQFNLAISSSLAALAILQLLHLHVALPFVAAFSAVALLLFLLLVLKRTSTRQHILLVMAAVAAMLVLHYADSPSKTIATGLQQAAFLAAFMVLLGSLRDAAVRSQAVLELGHYLTSRPPGRRYTTIHIGSQLLGMFLNFSAMTLLGPLIQLGAKAGAGNSPQLAALCERRQISALVRGFAWTISWSPVTVVMAITLSVVNGANMLMVCLCGLLANAGSLLIGYRIDRGTGEHAIRSLQNQGVAGAAAPVAFPAASFKRLLFVCLLLFAVALAIMQLSNSSIIAALMLAYPLITAGWLVYQQFVRHASHADSKTLLQSVFLQSLPSGTPEVVTLACAGFIGVAAAGSVDAARLAALLEFDPRLTPLVYISILALIPLASNLAMPPIMTVTFIGSLYSAMPAGSLNPNLLACTLIWGWALNLSGSPFGGVPLILARITGIPGLTLSWRWNGLFTLLLYAWCSAVLLLLAVFLQP